MRVFLRNFLILIKINLLRSFLTTYLNRIYRTLTQVSRYKLNENKLITFYIKNKHSFFGYYDINPISAKNDKVLGITINTKGNAASTAAVGYFNLSSPTNFLQVGKSKTWCWQQGNRLRWSTLDNDIIIYNKLVDDRYGCVFQNIKSKKIISSINFPIYDISTEERYGLSLNFSRLERLRPGYGYSNLPDLSSALKHPANDGVFLVDVGKNTSSLIISLDKLSRIEPCPSMEGAQHYINHLSWNLSGNRFLFFHLWAKGSTRRSRMFTSDLKGNDLFLIEKNENVSHYSWRNDQEILITTFSKKYGTRFSIYVDQTKKREMLSTNIINEDGHPSFLPNNKNIILSDSYPDKYGERSLYTYNLIKNKKTILGKFKSPLRFRSQYRCDLHPRWNNNGTLISFDSTHKKNLRTINILKIENPLHT